MRDALTNQLKDAAAMGTARSTKNQPPVAMVAR